MSVKAILPHLSELLEQQPRKTPQGFQPVYRNSLHSTSNSKQDIVYITPQLDPDLGRSIIYWKDIQETFKDALYIKNKVIHVPFLKDNEHKNRQPLRIGISPEAIFDVFLENPIQEGEEDIGLISIVEDLKIMEISDSDKTDTPKSQVCLENGLDSQSPLIIQPIQNSSHQHSNKLSQSQWKLRGMELTIEKAKNGNINSQFDLGVVYEIRHQDFSNAVEWYLKAATQGHASAQHRIGHLYDIGCGVPKDYSKAVEWYFKASEQLDPIAQNAIGIYYYEGTGLPQNAEKAYEWYLKSAAQGYSNAQRNIGLLFHDGDGVEKDYTKAMEWYRLSANQGNSFAQNSIATLYDAGLGVSRDYKKAIDWYIKAVEQGEHYALKNIGDLYDAGGEVREAIKWYMKSAIEGNSGAQKHLGYRYSIGNGVPQDALESLRWYHKAAKQGCSHSQHRIGELYALGHGIPQNYPKAAEWYRKAVASMAANSKGNIHPYPRVDLGKLYMAGRGVPMDFQIAKDLFSKVDFYHQSSFKRALILRKKQH